MRIKGVSPKLETEVESNCGQTSQMRSCAWVGVSYTPIADAKQKSGSLVVVGGAIQSTKCIFFGQKNGWEGKPYLAVTYELKSASCGLDAHVGGSKVHGGEESRECA